LINFTDDDKEAYDWAVKAIAQELITIEKEDFVRKFAPDELKRIYSVIEESVMPALISRGIPISRSELREMFLSWFVRKDLTPKERNPFRYHPTRDGEPHHPEDGPEPSELLASFYKDGLILQRNGYVRRSRDSHGTLQEDSSP
jgi:hypothetical protein